MEPAGRPRTGELAWRAAPPDGGAAPTALWQYDTAREFDTVNGVPAKGGNMSSAGPVVAGGMVFVPSGYSALGNGVRGNVVLAFGPK